MKRKRENQDAEMADEYRDQQQQQQPPPIVLDPILCSLLPRSVVVNHIMPFITHIFTSREKLIEAVWKYVDTIHPHSVM